MGHCKAFFFPLGAALATCVLALGCTDIDPCKEPRQTRSCTCSGGVPGTQVCLPEKVWDDCACGGDGDTTAAGSGGAGAGGAQSGAGAGQGTGSGGAGAGAGGTGAGGTSGGGSGAGGAPAEVDGGGMPSGDGGLPPTGDGGAPDAATAGQGGSGGGPAGDAYRTCMEDADCGSASACTNLANAFPPSDLSACAPECSGPSSCPTPAGNYEATVVCSDSHCRLDCTGTDLFATPLSCPAGFTCEVEDLISGTSYCYH